MWITRRTTFFYHRQMRKDGPPCDACLKVGPLRDIIYNYIIHYNSPWDFGVPYFQTDPQPFWGVLPQCATTGSNNHLPPSLLCVMSVSLNLHSNGTCFTMHEVWLQNSIECASSLLTWIWSELVWHLGRIQLLESMLLEFHRMSICVELIQGKIKYARIFWMQHIYSKNNWWGKKKIILIWIDTT